MRVEIIILRFQINIFWILVVVFIVLFWMIFYCIEFQSNEIVCNPTIIIFSCFDTEMNFQGPKLDLVKSFDLSWATSI